MSTDLAVIEAALKAATIADAPLYEVRSDGSVWSAWNWRGYGKRQLSPTSGKGGYLRVRLQLPNGRRVNRPIHSLVAEAFIGPRPEGHQVCHIDGDKTNNAASNLRYGTAQDNADDRSAHGRTVRGALSPNARLTPTDVVAIRQMSGMGDGPLAYAFGVSKRTVRRVIRRETYTDVA